MFTVILIVASGAGFTELRYSADSLDEARAVSDRLMRQNPRAIRTKIVQHHRHQAAAMCQNIAALVRLAEIMDGAEEPEVADVIDGKLGEMTTESIPQPSLAQLRNALMALDARLTGRNKGMSSDDELMRSLYDGNEYYLSDGGYSRVVLRPEEPDYTKLNLHLTSNSTDKVKEAWQEAQSERQAVIDTANKLYNDDAYNQLTQPKIR